MIREKEAAAFAEEKEDAETNIKAMAGAIPALEKGMGGASFVQMPTGDRVKKIAETFSFQDENDRRNIMAFLEQSGDYVPQSGQIVGILKTMKEEMEGNLKTATQNEASSSSGFEELKASKEAEVKVASQAIETKQSRMGELAVSVVQTQDDLEDTQKEVADSEKFAATLESECGTKEQEWAAREKLRAEEIAAISDAIGILNDDDALDVFKKAIPASALIAEERAGFLQRSVSAATRLGRAQSILSMVARKSKHSSAIRLILFTLSSKLKAHQRRQAQGLGEMSFGDVTKMVDEMVVIEGKEQDSDDHQKPWCNGEFDKSAREEASEKSEIAGLDAEIEQEQDMIAAINEEIAVLKEEVAALDKSVAEATEQRKEEHAEYAETTQLTSTAVDLVKKAKNRLNKFYNPVLYKAAPVKKEMSMEEKILDAGGFLAQRREVSEMHRRIAVAPPPPPETFGSYEKSSEKSTGVLGLMDMIVKELEADMKDGEYEEKTAQKDYQELMSDSAGTREGKIRSITDKEAGKTQIQQKKLVATEKEKGDYQDVDAIHETVANLHTDCG